MITVINDMARKDYQHDIVAMIEQHYMEVRRILPKLPEDMQIYFDDEQLTFGYGCGGFAYDKDIITIGFDVNFKDKEAQARNLRSTLFHEAYHIAQGYYFCMEQKIRPIEEAVYEGAATVFERDIAGSKPPYGDYEGAPVTAWLKSIKSFNEDYDYQKWKFWDDEDHVAWKMYKAGAYIVDQALQNSGKTIVELNSMSAKEIINLSKSDH